MLVSWGAPLLGLWAVLLEAARGEPVPATTCPRGLSWSPDLEKCMDCVVCQTQNKNDFCSTCGDAQPPDSFHWWILGVSVGTAFVLLISIIGGIVAYTRCRRREKFTTPIEETGGHSAQESLID
ncbi:tumor necrosis factor receptor superfamily member 12A [Paroedura picta]|uniref:tumor necrosis factor receptor superfamily member 12A n=1 Tax=Paroedura picta TaxID=143630 RepID=UPI0040566A92